jgi:hypothetical protein
MARVRYFVADLAKTALSVKEIQEIVEKAYGDKALKRSQIYRIVRQVKAGEDVTDQRNLNAKKTKRSDKLIGAVAADVKRNCALSAQELAIMHDVSCATMLRILKEDLGLKKGLRHEIDYELVLTKTNNRQKF